MSCSHNKIPEEITMALAHEVKNPVSLIKAHIELLELDERLSEYNGNFKIIKKELHKISEIVSDFMVFCKPTRILEGINLVDIIEDTIKEFDIYNQKNIKFYLAVNCDKNCFFINAHPLKMSMLFTNIYKNAIESIKSDGSIETILYIKENRPIIDIIDDGEGLVDALNPNIESSFISNKIGGTGLGIPICKNILKDINGNFEIFNNIDKGCTVRITF